MQNKPIFQLPFIGNTMPEGEAMVRWALNEVVVTPSYGSDTLLTRITLCQVRVDDVSHTIWYDRHYETLLQTNKTLNTDLRS